MNKIIVMVISRGAFALVALLMASWPIIAQDAKESSFAPIGHYLIERSAEIDLARSAAPPALSNDAEVLVLEPHGYETAVKGKNGFVCLVQRGWTAGFDDPEFGSPKLLYPACYNPPAARSYLPLVFKKTQLALTRSSRAEMSKGIKTAFDKKELPDPESGSMCYMMSKQGYFGRAYGHANPHLMFFVSLSDRKLWGAGVVGSPIELYEDASDQLAVFVILVSKWSDGTPAPPVEH